MAPHHQVHLLERTPHPPSRNQQLQTQESLELRASASKAVAPAQVTLTSFYCVCTNLLVSVKVVVFGDEFSVILLLTIKHLFLTRPVASSSNMFP